MAAILIALFFYFIVNIFFIYKVLIDLNSLILLAAKWVTRSAGSLSAKGKVQMSVLQTKMQSNVLKQYPLCVCKYDRCLPGDSLKLQLQETVFFFVSHSEHQRGCPEGQWGPTAPRLSVPWERMKIKNATPVIFRFLHVYTQYRRVRLQDLKLPCFKWICCEVSSVNLNSDSHHIQIRN